MKALLAPAGCVVATFLLVLCQLDPGGADPGMPQGPGLTVDEGFYTQQGAYLSAAVRTYGVAIAHPASLREVFEPGEQLSPRSPPARQTLARRLA